MYALRFSATITLLLFFTGQPAVAQEANVPQHFTQFCEKLVGSWEGEMINTMANGAEQTIPIMCEYRKILNGTAVYGEATLAITPEYVVEFIQIIAWDAMQKKAILFEAADNSEAAYSTGTKPDFMEVGYSLTMTKDTDEGMYEATTLISFPSADEMLYKVRYQRDGRVSTDQKIILERQ